MRLLLVIDEENVGGAELSFLELARAISSKADVHLALGESALQREPGSMVYRDLQRAGITVQPCRNPLYPGTVCNLHRGLRRRPARELARIIERLQPSTIITNLPTVERGQTIVDAAELPSSRPMVWGLLHLVHQPSTLGARMGRLRNLMVGRLLRRFDRLLTVSHTGARQLAERYGLPEPDTLYPPTTPLVAVESPAERGRQRARAGLPDVFLLGIVGRIELRQKGQDAALRTAARLLGQAHPVQVVVIGDGPDAVALERMAHELGISDRVRFLGWRQDAGRLIPLLDAIVLPSRFEGMPQTALQAASAGVPVVGYAVDGLRELLPPVFQVPLGDESGLARVLSELLEGTRRWPAEELAERAREWGDPARAADRLLGLLRAAQQARS
jgi:glycosyltransferase involved in cell wall biosynthesis